MPVIRETISGRVARVLLLQQLIHTARMLQRQIVSNVRRQRGGGTDRHPYPWPGRTGRLIALAFGRTVRIAAVLASRSAPCGCAPARLALPEPRPGTGLAGFVTAFLVIPRGLVVSLGSSIKAENNPSSGSLKPSLMMNAALV